MRRTVLVLGGTGVLGAALCARFSALGDEVVATARAGSRRRAAPAPGAVLVPLDVTDEEGWPAALRAVGPERVDLVVDAIGAYTPAPLHTDKSAAERVLWVNSLARGRLLDQLVARLPPGSGVVRVDSSLGDFPSRTDTLVSAAKAADRVMSYALADTCRRRGVSFGSLVLTAVEESLDARQRALFVRRFGHEPPSAAAVAEAVSGLAALSGIAQGSARLWFPWHGIGGDPLAEDPC
ncbi:SDR family NAD(P)-dependent oxidoreductase [Streptomyces sp. MNP-20]|uniref:SDR family NAD(P)-dependent oxidoreductase n=1 Tax=Streptomyces sp. MNP-20 TaxID=2721165 RepID=UPI0015540478|nr:SDR family oxidoreductase [Streptomyces sp. MNP-20]